MKIFKNLALLLLTIASSIWASYRDVDFMSCPSAGECVYYKEALDPFVNNQWNQLAVSKNARIRIMNLAKNTPDYPIKIERPFLILDGIYLSTEGTRTLGEFQKETEQLGIPDMLSELGYTPILVQFTETVKRSLDLNGHIFAAIMQIMNASKFFDFPNKQRDGFVVLGISQGGILGRYGSYLYDVYRGNNDAPIRLFASLDSPHQGAVLPLSLYYTINFWATKGGSAAAEAFRDLIDGPGASELLLYDYDKSAKNREYRVNTSAERFLFGEYRKAAEYKGFPSVLVAQGQLKGTIPQHSPKYFELNRRVKKLGTVMGRAESRMASYQDGVNAISFNRVYQKLSRDERDTKMDAAKYDFVQGSTYPFAETMYQSLRDGFLEALPSKMHVGSGIFKVEMVPSWETDVLEQKNSTFIPTVSAMDLKCSGDLSIKGNCAFTQNSNGFPFVNPGNRSTGNAVYAVDLTHPRYSEPISGRHIELPLKENGSVDSLVASGFQVDIWRILCELSHYDYDNKSLEFRNENLEWYFSPNTNCMDVTKIPQVIRNGGLVQPRRFAYIRYDYQKLATEKDENVSFEVPAGWHKVAIYDNGKDIAEGASFEVDVAVENSKGNWMKAELLLTKSKSGSGQLQLQEISVPMDGKFHRLRWKLPATQGALDHYRWFRLVLNSDGAKVTVSKAMQTKSTMEAAVYEKGNPSIYPSQTYRVQNWKSSVSVTQKNTAKGNGFDVQFSKIGGGAYVDFMGMKNFDAFNYLKVYYEPGTCQGTDIYFDSFRLGQYPLKNARLEGNYAVATVLLSEIINTNVTPDNKKMASKLILQNVKPNERCFVYKILAE